MRQSLPDFGTLTLYAVMVAAAYTLAVALVAGRGRPRHLQAARLGAYGTVALIGLSVLCLAYGFLTHDFRIKYVAHYSDRSMSTGYLLAALWGGQDGSVLWWLFLLGVYTASCVYWLRGRFRELQPYIIATLIAVILFFSLLMAFPTNPFGASAGGAPLDGQGLNAQLQNFYMIIHPPSLYTGFVGCAVPFAFAVAALVTGRLDGEWLAGCRSWMLFAWLFLSIGNALGMLWAYEALGWGGYWAWDPVENAAFLPWLTATAFLHSLMIQERRGMLRKWNITLVLGTFLLTIFGTFLTRSGLIASVHAFAQSGIGAWFVWFMALIVGVSVALVARRLAMLRSDGRIESALSREAAFVANNWMFIGLLTFILVATVFPRLSEWILKQPSAVGPSFYNAWLPIPGVVLLALMGVAPLLGWRKTSQDMLKRAAFVPLAAAAVVALLHVALGKSTGYPAFVVPDRIYEGLTGRLLQWIDTPVPVLITSMAALNIAVVVQEFWRGVAARRRAQNEPAWAALFGLIAKSRHRYGGYVVHVGIALMFLGFAGRSWGVDTEASLRQGESARVGHYTVRYAGPRTEVDASKRMVFADLTVKDATGRDLGSIGPAKFIYRKSPDSPVTEVAMVHSLLDDLYVIVGAVSPEARVATFQMHMNPLVSFIWAGVLVLVLGSVIAMWPEVSPETSRSLSYLRSAGVFASLTMLVLLLAIQPVRMFASFAGRTAATMAPSPRPSP
jgi:cytochrome c-type biogenesis protein CcmF